MSNKLGNLKIMHSLDMFIQAGNADSSAALVTTLGNLGISNVKFAQQFNEFTKNLPEYFIVRTHIQIHSDRSFSFQVSRPSTGNLLKALTFSKSYLIKEKNRNITVKYNCCKVKDFLHLTQFIFPKNSSANAVLAVYGSLKSAQLYLVYE